MNASTLEPLPFILRERLKTLQDAISQPERADINTDKAKSWQMHKVYEILSELTRNWITWLKPDQPKI